MRFSLKKKRIKAVLIFILAIVLAIVALKFISIWDSKQGMVEVDNLQPTVSGTNPTPSFSVREPTEEEIADFVDGTITKEDLIQDIVDDALVYQPDAAPDEGTDSTPAYTPDDSTGDGAGETEGNVGGVGQPVQNEYERRVAEIIAEVYVLRDHYIATLESVYSQAEGEFALLAGKEDNDDEIMSLVSAYLSKGTALEQQCDGRISTLMDELKGILKANGQGYDLVNEITYAYAHEKSVKKAWYMSEIERRGLN